MNNPFGISKRLLAVITYITVTSPALLVVEATAQTEASVNLTWRRLSPLPDEHGLAGGCAGVSNGALLVAGGANFPVKPVWEGGKKIWHDRIFVLEKPDDKWLTGSRLPFAIGYGVSITTPNGVLCIGGSDAEKHYSDAFLLEWVKGSVKYTKMPNLPMPVANASGALVGSTVYIAGGIDTPSATKALKTFWSIDLSERKPKWRELPPWPGPERMLSVAAAHRGSFYLISGASLSSTADGSLKRTYLRDGFRYRPGKGWKRIADVPAPVVAAPSPAVSVGRSGFAIFGGDDGSKAGFSPVSKHPGFSRKVLLYNVETDKWSDAGMADATQVTTPLVRWRNGFVIPSGEIRPGVRSRDVWYVTTN